MRPFAPLLAACLVFFSSANAKGDVTVSIDFDLMTAGIQSNIFAVAGDEINAGIVLHVTGDAQFTGYAFGVDIPDAIVNFGPSNLNGFVSNPMNGGARDLAVMTNSVNRGAAGTHLDAVNTQTPFDLGPATDDNPIAPDATSFTTGGLSFGNPLRSPILDFTSPTFRSDFNQSVHDFVLVATEGGTGSISFQPEQPTNPFFLDALNLGTVTFNPGQITVTAVPEPSTWAFLGLGTLVVARRHRKKAKAKKSTVA